MFSRLISLSIDEAKEGERGDKVREGIKCVSYLMNQGVRMTR